MRMERLDTMDKQQELIASIIKAKCLGIIFFADNKIC